MSDSQTLTAARTPVVYFIDDSATMREVIKIAFRKENIQVITCADAASALAQFGNAAPDAVITDVIMPDKDGYEVCDFIKKHEQFGKTPVILMSGVVNRSVAEKATAVRADELIRKPFQPHDLIVRVKILLGQGSSVLRPPSVVDEMGEGGAQSAAKALSNLFGAGPAPSADPFGHAPRTAMPVAIATATPTLTAPAPPRPAMPVRPQPAAPAPTQAGGASSAELLKLRNEVRRLELLVKKLQAELEAEHQYCAALEAHVKTLQEAE
jgi:CheY-like chemotaxis protein